VDLAGKIALVTGAGRRVGRAIAEELGRAGARVAVHHHRSRAGAEELAAALPGAFVVAGDLRTAAGCRALLDDVGREGGALHLLVNSAAGYLRGPFADESEETWDEMLALNLRAPARLIRGALPLGLAAVVNVVDVAAERPWRRHAAYAASKAALAHLTRCLALELAPSVRVNAVAPGTVAFPPDFGEPERRAITSRIPLGRIGAPADVARAARFLLEEDYLTGVVLPVDGGAALV
jgi:pteridine reductase